jgi:hypothetical protein
MATHGAGIHLNNANLFYQRNEIFTTAITDGFSVLSTFRRDLEEVSMSYLAQPKSRPLTRSDIRMVMGKPSSILPVLTSLVLVSPVTLSTTVC